MRGAVALCIENKRISIEIERISIEIERILIEIERIVIENLETTFWEGPKSRKLEKKIMSYVRAFKFGFQLWF